MDRQALSNLVVLYLRGKGFPTATEQSNFGTDIGVDGIKRRTWAPDICRLVIDEGGDPKGFGPAECEQAKNVRAIIDALEAAMK